MEPANSSVPKARANFCGLEKIKVSFTNVDCLTNKLSELSNRVEIEKPLILGVSEVLPKNIKNKIIPEIFNLDNYEMITHPNIKINTGRGSILYIHKSLSYKQITLADITNFDEIIPIEIKLNKTDTLLCALIYRNGDFTDWHIENNTKFYNAIRHISSLNYSHIVLMGDLNFRGIDWETIKNNENNTSQRNENDNFIQCIRDSFLFQHITEPTRQRGSDKPSILDLILTNEEKMISDIKIDSPIGASDHSFISFNLNCNIQGTPPKNKVMYDKGNDKKMGDELCKINWDELFHSHQDDVNAQWEFI